jgi:hypothetical protein
LCTRAGLYILADVLPVWSGPKVIAER